MTIQTIEEKRKARRKESAEDFTPLPLVNEILDRLSLESKDSVWAEDKTFVDPSCGNGNFLIEVLKRKLKKKHSPLIALKTIYGADIMKDNIDECRLRLLKVISNSVKAKRGSCPERLKKAKIDMIKTVYKNIKWVDLSKYPKGSLDYDFEFEDELSDERAEKTLKKIKEGKLLDSVSVD